MSENSSEASDSPVDAISELAQERRKLAQIESERPRPAFIEEVETSEVIYYFQLAAVPFRQLEVSALSEALDDLYKVQIKGPDLSPLLSTVPREQLAAISETELMARLVRADDALLAWTDGRFPLRDDFVPIRQITLSREAIQVNVSGVSQIAEVIVKEVIELTWKLTGSKKKYSDIEKYLKVAGYGTRTRLNLGYGPECLLNPQIMKFMNDNLTKGSRFAASMGRVVLPDTEEKEVNAVAALDDLTLHINKFDLATGFSDDSDIRFSITASSDYKSGRLAVTSTLPYEKHVQLVSGLFKAIGESD